LKHVESNAKPQDAFELYHLEQEEPTSALSTLLGGPALPALGHATSGAIGSAISNVITYPLALVITRLQVQKQFEPKSTDASAPQSQDAEYKDVVDAIKKIYKNEGGIRAFYAGIGQDTVKTCMDAFLFFLAYNFLRHTRNNARSDRKRLPIHEELAVGMLAGSFAKLWTTPISNIVTRKQTAAMVASRVPASTQSEALSAKSIALQIRHEKGIKGFWSGYSASVVLTLNPAITFLLHETFLRILVHRENRQNPGSRVTFLIAAISKAIASSITYPFQLAKSRAQVGSSKPFESNSEKSEEMVGMVRTNETQVGRNTIFSTVLRIAQEEGLSGLYQGLFGEVFKGFFSHGLTMLLKERVHIVVVQLYYFVLRLLRRYPSPEELAKMAQERTATAQKSASAAVSSAVGATADAVKSGVSGVNGANEKVQEMVQRGVDTMSELYREGKEATVDIIDEYIGVGDDEDDDPNGWGW
jgi:Mitochondrial carrier protein